MSTTGYQFTAGWTIDRGRSYELDKTATGSAVIRTVDMIGALDPTNPGSPFAGQLDPMQPGAIALQNPVTGGWSTLFRGFTAEYRFEVDVSEVVIRGEIELVDAFEILAATEVIPGDYGDAAPADSKGDAWYAAQPVDDRIRAALEDANWPAVLTNIFTGNVWVQDVVYSPRSQILAVIQDAADAEFPGVANVFVSKDGIVTFHGRKARFNPTDPQYNINQWHVGDTAAYTADTNVAPLATLSFSRDKERIVNAAISTPQNIRDSEIEGQNVADATSIDTYGVRSLSFENLLTLRGKDDGLGANDETKLFSTYYVDNLKDPQNRITQMSFRPLQPSHPNAAALWSLMCEVEIGDLITVTTSHPGGGGFDDDFFVEGIHYTAEPMNDEYPDITLTLDVSPRAFFDTDPFT